MSKFDLEIAVDSISAMMKANLNTKITEINADKADAITLPQVSDSAYFTQGLNSATINFNPFISISVEEISTESIHSLSLNTYNIVCALCFADYGEDVQIYKRLFRYSRALKEIFETNWYQAVGSVRYKVENLAPISFKLPDTDQFFRAVGVSIHVTF